MARYGFNQWVDFIERDDEGNAIEILQDFRDWYRDHNDINISIEKSLAGLNDTATVEIWNHRELENAYRDKDGYFSQFRDRNIEICLMQWFEEPHATLEADTTHCIFQGDMMDIQIGGDSSITDQALSFHIVAGQRASTWAIVNKKYSAGMTYRDVVSDLFTFFEPYGYAPPLIDDPLGKLGKVLPKSRTYHRKVSEVLNDIARDLEMIWGFDSNPWTLEELRIGGTNPFAISEPKHCWFADKVSVFDVTGIHGTTFQELDGSTSKTGRIGYEKSQFTLNHQFESVFNVGIPVDASDFGTMNAPFDIGDGFKGRINRISVNNENVHLECAYIDPDTGLAVLEKDKKNAGQLVL